MYFNTHGRVHPQSESYKNTDEGSGTSLPLLLLTSTYPPVMLPCHGEYYFHCMLSVLHSASPEDNGKDCEEDDV